MDNQTAKELCKTANSLKSDIEKLMWIQENQDLDITVYLDNDDSFATFDDVEYDFDEADDYIIRFDDYFGWKPGVFNLFEMLDIKAEGV